jgi:hypothetical protein
VTTGGSLDSSPYRAPTTLEDGFKAPNAARTVTAFKRSEKLASFDGLLSFLLVELDSNCL